MKITTIVLSVHNILFILSREARERGRKAIVIMTVIRISVYCTGLHGLATTFSCLIFSVFFCSLIRFILELRGVLWIHGAPWLFFLCFVFAMYFDFFSSFYLLIFMFFCVSYQLTYVHLLPLKISITSKILITISPQIDAKEPFKMPSKKLNPIFFSLVLCVFLVLIDWNRMSLLLKESKKKTVHRTFCRLFQFEFDFLKLVFTYFRGITLIRFLSEFRHLYLCLSK